MTLLDASSLSRERQPERCPHSRCRHARCRQRRARSRAPAGHASRAYGSRHPTCTKCSGPARRRPAAWRTCTRGADGWVAAFKHSPAQAAGPAGTRVQSSWRRAGGKGGRARGGARWGVGVTMTFVDASSPKLGPQSCPHSPGAAHARTPHAARTQHAPTEPTSRTVRPASRAMRPPNDPRTTHAGGHQAVRADLRRSRCERRRIPERGRC